jgi:hypothetical protein
MKSKSETARPSSCCRAVLAVSCAVAAGWTSTTQAQVSNFAPASLKKAARVSVRVLKIPSKASDEFEQGLQRLTKRDTAGSLEHFDAAIRVFPGYYEVYSTKESPDCNFAITKRRCAAFKSHRFERGTVRGSGI